MPQKMTRRLLLATSCLVASAALAGPAAAQSASDMQRLESQIQSLQQQLNALKAAPAPAAAPAAPANAPHVVETAGHRFGLESADGANSIYLTGRVHFDVGSYIHDKATGNLPGSPSGTNPNPLNSGTNVRRARLGVTGKFQDDFAYTFIMDVGGTSDSFDPADNAGASKTGIENAFITYNGFYKPTYKVPVAIDLGVMDIPYTLNEATSSNDIMFMERPSSNSIASNFAGNDNRSAIGIRSNNKDYFVGTYLTGPKVGTNHSLNAGTSQGFGDEGVTFRATYQVINRPDDTNLHVGVNMGHLFRAKGNTYTFSDGLGIRVDPTTMVSAAMPGFSSGTVYGPELAGQIGHFFAQGEYYRYNVSQRDITNAPHPDLDFDGGYVEASYSFGGKRHYNPAAGSYTGVIPEHPFSLKTGGWGALELAARFDSVNLNDHVPAFPVVSSWTTTGNIGGGDQNRYTLGVNWYVNNNMRFMFNYEHLDLNDQWTYTAASSTTAASLVHSTAHVDAVGGRMQFNF